MNRSVIADTGPLVALFDRGDAFHAWAKDCLGRVMEPLLTSEAVLGEVFFLLSALPGSRAAFAQFWAEGALRVALDAQAHRDSLVGLLRKYADTPMSLADATVVRLCEFNRQAVVWALDRHFRIYRQLGRKTIPLLDWPRE
ncbi:MAG: PIN domain-containing protein [Verrucomicrobia bacterium]|nr:MAG: PIN domain-containing protein [Verrucomicrobiota bacterium]